MATMRRTYKYRLYDSKQNKHLEHAINVAGMIRNHVIALQRRYYKLTSKYIPLAQMQAHIGKLRMGRVSANKKLGRRGKSYGKKYTYWQAISAQATQEICERVDKSYQRFFKNQKLLSNQRKKVSPPQFKKVKKYSSFTLKTDSWKLVESHRGSRKGSPKVKNERRTGKVQIMKRTYKFVWTRPIMGKIKTVTVKRDKTGKLWLCFSVEETITITSQTSSGKIGGFDFGLTYFLTTETGQRIESPQFYRQMHQQLAHLHRNLSKKRKGSNNWYRAKRALARAYQRLDNLRTNHHWQLAHDLCNQYDALIFETLNIKAMQKLWGRKVSDLSFSNFLKIVEHVATKRGVVFQQIDQWIATSKTCSHCDARFEKLTLADRWVTCHCGLSCDRDHNAARNIHKVGTSTFGLVDVRQDEVYALPAIRV
ncbi:MAG: transposase [Chloroflexota bacterium]